MGASAEWVRTLGPEWVEGDLPVEPPPALVAGEGSPSGKLIFCIDEFIPANRWRTWREGLARILRGGERPVALVVPELVDSAGIPQVVVKNPRQAFGHYVARMAGQPSNGLRLVGITGTNGKTTTTRVLEHLFVEGHGGGGSLGTLGLSIGGKVVAESEYTTPPAGELQCLLAKAVGRKVPALAMEVSSHALALDRVAGCRFAAAGITNMARDHLDFHATEEGYVEAKTRLFESLEEDAVAVIPENLRHSGRFLKACRKAGARLVRTGWNSTTADVSGRVLSATLSGSVIEFQHNESVKIVETTLAGRFQCQNLLTALGIWVALGEDFEGGCNGLASVPPVPGRMEVWQSPKGIPVIVDYAHNPDGLRNFLSNVRELTTRRLVVVFGCGGDRDRGKRPLMGAIAAELGDVCRITSDNPRTEDPGQIIRDILAGVPHGGKTLSTESDRRRAIEEALAEAGKEDCILIAGKGHENYQIIGTDKRCYSDQAVLEASGCRRSAAWRGDQ